MLDDSDKLWLKEELDKYEKGHEEDHKQILSAVNDKMAEVKQNIDTKLNVILLILVVLGFSLTGEFLF